MKKIKIGIVTGSILFILAVILLWAANHVGGFAQWYSVVIYDAFVSIFARIYGIFPFSVVEILLYLLIISCIFLIGRFVVQFVKNVIHKKSNKRMLGNYATFFFVLISALFLYM